ncbi:hypothetical protein RFI_22391 [Reticulomyxa filosa]|uniref:Uncharacterized protein n=1 Tax=Reticulomyxa filosa TaxID=46433 RepID=X6MNH8_RETFI|nr:hypothetical protein RFI_22391 [Reticulomyxa filosa]|eukprot:ETO14977.1 hypothetical protein RFI_22391 [Reticulomyxa filosa]
MNTFLEIIPDLHKCIQNNIYACCSNVNALSPHMQPSFSLTMCPNYIYIGDDEIDELLIELGQYRSVVHNIFFFIVIIYNTKNLLTLIMYCKGENKKKKRIYHVTPGRKEIGLTKIGLLLKNFEIDIVKYVNHHRSETFEGNEKKVNELLHQLSQHENMTSYIDCDMETSRIH